MTEKLSYRPCAGFMLANEEGKVLVGQRIGKQILGTWQMPQGGIDPGEDEETAAWRELHEETGIEAQHVKIIARASQSYRYDLPTELQGQMWGGKYRGQEQNWFLGRFLGTDDDIDLEAHEHPEFQAYQWVEPERLPDLIVPFKREVYTALVEEFRDLI